MENQESTIKSPAAALIGDPARYGRVDESGTVYVQTDDGERAVGSYPGKTPDKGTSWCLLSKVMEFKHDRWCVGGGSVGSQKNAFEGYGPRRS